ncbi:MAG: carbohydrate binding family 9 domain-containing protein, partial [Thermoanaerobaculia bacterium]
MKRRALIAALFCSSFAVVQAQEAKNVALQIRRATTPITIDGDLSDPAWKQAVPVDKWYETNPGDNVEPKAKSVGYLLYDDKFFYAGFEFSDPNPSQIRAPFADRDHIGGNTDDYAGVILDTRNDGKTGILFLANPRGIEYDAVSDDISGNEDSSPDFFWDAAGRITATGWTL